MQHGPAQDDVLVRNGRPSFSWVLCPVPPPVDIGNQAFAGQRAPACSGGFDICTRKNFPPPLVVHGNRENAPTISEKHMARGSVAGVEKYEQPFCDWTGDPAGDLRRPGGSPTHMIRILHPPPMRRQYLDPTLPRKPRRPPPRGKIITVSARRLIPGDEPLIPPRPGPRSGHPYLPRQRSPFRKLSITHPPGMCFHLTCCLKSHPTYVTTDTRCSASPTSAIIGAKSSSIARSIGPISRSNTLKSSSGCGYNDPKTCLWMRK